MTPIVRIKTKGIRQVEANVIENTISLICNEIKATYRFVLKRINIPIVEINKG